MKLEFGLQFSRLPVQEESSMIKKIDEAFQGISLQGGITIDNAIDIDDRIQSKKPVVHHKYQVTDELIKHGEYSCVLAHMDPKGFKFHIPFYMKFSLKNDTEIDVIDEVIYALSKPDLEIQEEKHAVFNRGQISVIIEYLDYLAAHGHEDIDIDEALKASKYWRLKLASLKN